MPTQLVVNNNIKHKCWLHKMLNTDSFLKCTRKILQAEIMRKKTYIPMFNVFTGVSEGTKIFHLQ